MYYIKAKNFFRNYSNVHYFLNDIQESSIIRPLIIETGPLIRTFIFDHKQFISLHLSLTIKTNFLLRPFLVGPWVGLCAFT